MFKKVTLILMTLALVAGTASADMTYAPFLFSAMDSTGAPIDDGTFVMVADLNNNGWGGMDYAAQSLGENNASDWLWDAQDAILDMGAIIGGEAYPLGKIATASKSPELNVGDAIYLLWFDVDFDSAAQGPGANVSYGVEMIGSIDADPGDYTFFPNGGSANLVTVPEPASAMLFLAGAAMLCGRRR